MKHLSLTVAASLISLFLVAQEKSTDVNINVDKDGGGSIWGSPALWIIGAAVFILLLVALTRRGSRE